ncbi:MAG: helicase-exonuclease AddAB subunit AddA [Suilimivivens sp.]
MAVVFTPEQQKVIDLHGRNILVSAAAGSGKTAVLVERIIQMILDEKNHIDIDRLLVVTFTNAAAAEMRERISQAIDRKLEEQPENEHLQKQAALLHNAQITTIDSFCLFLIRNNFNDIGLDPGFRVADEGELKLMKQDVLTELLEEKYGEKDADFLNCVEYFTGGSNDKQLEEYIEKLYEFSMSNPWPEEWLSERKQDYEITGATDIEESSWCRYLVDYARICLEECAESLSQAIELAHRPEGPWFYGELLEKEQEMLQKASEKENFTALSSAFDEISFGRLPGKKDESVDAQCRERAKQIRNEVKKQVESLKESYFQLSLEQVLLRMHMAEKPVETLMELVLQFKRMLDERKRTENIIDFHDMEHFALHILLKKDESSGAYVATAAAKEYRQFFQEILIDEYQDSNLVQELLLQSISGEEEGHFNRFMVGDVKQSIYKFRLARPELFIEKYTCYTKADSDRQRIDLHKNFRSRKEVIDSVNNLFTRIMGRNFGGIEYDDDAALYPGAVYPENEGNETEMILMGKDRESLLSAREQEALAIADRIKRLIREFQVTDKETGLLRPVKYSDIVILLRTTSGWAEDFKGIFEKEGIPAYVSSRTGYFQAAEVRELLQLLHVLNNPFQDIPLFGTMKSFFGGFSDDEIAWIRSRGKRGSFLYENLKEANEKLKLADESQNPEDAAGGLNREKIKSKINNLLSYIENWRAMAAYTPIHRLIQEILTETGYLEYVSSKPGGEQRRANVEMLLVRASAFENTSYYGLFHFLRYMEQLEKYQVDYGEADILDENANVVRIMSIHKSKGLEFPVCFVAGLSKKFNMQDTTGRFIADVDMGIGVDYIDSVRRVQSKTLRKNVIAMKLKLDSLSEELRILYVAMTRAREKLILTATIADIDRQKSELEQNRVFMNSNNTSSEKVPFSVLASASSYLDFILPCVDEKEITWICPGDIVISGIEETIRVNELKQELLLSPLDNQIMTELSQKFERRYPYEALSNLFVKTTVSELKKAGAEHLSDKSIDEMDKDERGGGRTEAAFTKVLYEEPEVVPYIPSFIKEKEGMSGTDRGSAYHKVMELLDLKKIYFLMREKSDAQTDRKSGLLEKELLCQLDDLEKSEKLSPEWREAVSVSKLLSFLKTDLAKRMMAADAKGKLHREQPFVLGLPANRLNREFPESEMVLIQGIIDVFFEEEDHIILADYKTDRVEEKEELIRRYKVQLDYYAEALERLTGKPVKSKIIYSFALSLDFAIDK